MAAADIASGKGNNGGSYPLVPFAGRIRDGRLDSRGEPIQLAPNWPGAPHPLHGAAGRMPVSLPAIFTQASVQPTNALHCLRSALITTPVSGC